MKRVMFELPCYICGQLVWTKRKTMKACREAACRAEHQRRKRLRRRHGHRMVIVPDTSHERPWGEASWYSLLEEIDRCGMSIAEYAEMFKRHPKDVEYNLHIARRLGFAGLDELRARRQGEAE